MTLHEFQARARKAIVAKSDELALANGRNHTRTLEDLRYWAGVADGLLLAAQILDETLKSTEEEDD